MRKNKGLITLLVLVAMSLPLVAAACSWNDGTFEGTGRGFSSDITFAVTIENGAIVDIEVLDVADTLVFRMQLRQHPRVIEAQSVEVDTVTGATGSSKGVIAAITAALEAASK